MRVFLLLLISISSFSQIVFEKGYLIDNDGKRIDCLIKNVDWKDNPTKFYYKVLNNDSMRTGDLESVKEFQVLGYSKYVRANVKIDRSKTNMSDLSNDRNPVWSQEKLFLKTLIESRASLYSFTEGNLTRFFYSTSSVSVEQLIYKEYLIDQSTLAYNNFYKNQLSLNVRCKGQNINSLTNLRYAKKDLEKYFTKYNLCEGDSVISKSTEKRRDNFHFKITPGFNYSSLRIANPMWYSGIINFNNTVNFRLGAELEYVFPFNKNKWSFVFEPTYQTMSSTSPHQGEAILYNSIEFPVGLRHYFFLSKDVTIFLNGFYISPYIYEPNHSAIKFKSPGQQLEVAGGNTLSIGLGCNFKRMSIEVRSYRRRDILASYLNWASDYKRLAVIFGYKVFNKKTK